MAKLAVQPHVLKDIVLSVAADDYARHVSTARLEPTTTAEKITWHGLSPDAAFSESGTPETTWALVLTYAQDWNTENSLSQYLLDNAGEAKTVVLQPRAGSGQKTFTVEAVIAPGPVGGDYNTVAVGTVTLGVNGQPTVGATA